MAEQHPPTAGAAAHLAKGALRRLAAARLEPTPANFARAYAEEAGEPLPSEGLPAKAKPLVDKLVARSTDDPALRAELAAALLGGRLDDLQRALDRGADAAVAQSQAWAQLIERLAKGLERSSREWTSGRKKDSLQRVLAGSRSDAQRLQQRLLHLITAWEEGTEDQGVELNESAQRDAGMAVAAAPTEAAASAVPSPPGASFAATETALVAAVAKAAAPDPHHPRMQASLSHALRAGLPASEPRAVELADELAALADRIQQRGASAELADQVAQVCARAERLFAHRHHLVDELMQLCRSLTDGMADLAEDGSWAQGQSQAMAARLEAGAGARAVHAARELLENTRHQQRQLCTERNQARDALKAVIHAMLSELGELGQATGRFNDNVARYAVVIEQADTLESLADLVREMAGESRAVHEVVAGARDRLAQEHAHAAALEGRVRELESELRRLSDEVSTDALTQVANRRGMAAAFEAERARVDRGGPGLAIALIDIDNFKRLNDTLGHAAGDVALKSLAARVKEWLRPVDHLARFGGEEFVVLLPATPVDEAQQVLTRLQRKLSAALFMHEGREVFVTFSAGVTAHRPDEPIDIALERADEALYEAKRTGKNRTCIA
ncbi:MAG: diguanylate cyclase [Ideonella sp.]|nr:diguanylate cyclase [Ideonella sp.]